MHSPRICSLLETLSTHRKEIFVSVLLFSTPQLFATIPRQFLPHIKNPCWLAEFSGESRADPYKGNRYFLRAFDQLRTNFQAHLCHRDGRPYVYIIGQPKCGTTDLFSRLLLHEEVMFTMKEPHWWTRRHFGKPRLMFFS